MQIQVWKKNLQRLKGLEDNILIRKQFIYNLFIGLLLKRGHRLYAEKLLISVLSQIRIKTNKDPFMIIEECVDKLKPIVNLRYKVVSGTIYRLPVTITRRKSYALAIRWLVKSAQQRLEKSIDRKLYEEFATLIEGIAMGGAMNKKEELYKIAILNRPFMRYLVKRKKKSKINFFLLTKREYWSDLKWSSMRKIKDRTVRKKDKYMNKPYFRNKVGLKKRN
jgi:small subunit ribosomal protein S7